MCDNFETYYVPRGYDYRKVETRCGNTKTDGSRAICEVCAADPKRMREIKRQEGNVRADNDWSHSAGWGDW